MAIRLVGGDREVPLGSFPIGEARPASAPGGALPGALERRIVMRIPEPRWGDRTWTFEVEAFLGGGNGVEACDAMADALWLHVDPRSRLTLPRREAPPGGLAGWAASLDARPALVVPPKLGQAAALQLGLVVAELASLPGPFRVRSEDDPPEGKRLLVSTEDAPTGAADSRAAWPAASTCSVTGAARSPFHFFRSANVLCSSAPRETRPT